MSYKDTELLKTAAFLFLLLGALCGGFALMFGWIP